MSLSAGGGQRFGQERLQPGVVAGRCRLQGSGAVCDAVLFEKHLSGPVVRFDDPFSMAQLDDGEVAAIEEIFEGGAEDAGVFQSRPHQHVLAQVGEERADALELAGFPAPNRRAGQLSLGSGTHSRMTPFPARRIAHFLYRHIQTVRAVPWLTLPETEVAVILAEGRTLRLIAQHIGRGYSAVLLQLNDGKQAGDT